MNPTEGIAPQMSTNEAARRILFIFMDENGTPKIGAPGGAISGATLSITKAEATGPAPALAILLVPERTKRVGMLLRNLDDTNTIWYSDNPNVTDATGATLEPKESVPISFTGPLYIYCLNGSPKAECVEVLSS